MPKYPDAYREFAERYPEVVAAYEALGQTAYAAGPLPPETQRLVKLALAIGAGLEGAVHSHTRRALEGGISADQVHQTVLLAVTTLGFPASMRAFTWVSDVIRNRENEER